MANALFKHIQGQFSSYLAKRVTIIDEQRVHGGDINTAFVIVTNEGSFFIKQNRASLTDMFVKEYNGLKHLKENTVLKVPQPLLCGTYEKDAYLVMEYVQKQTFTKTTWKALGEG
ncbi:MAG: fructosamine kinase family protein, partial [Bacteroidota bacterium]|nr:fructosamine kinase family protein [Bacteroidota bacterium]